MNRLGVDALRRDAALGLSGVARAAFCAGGLLVEAAAVDDAAVGGAMLEGASSRELLFSLETLNTKPVLLDETEACKCHAQSKTEKTKQ